jgi:hypothetical protein
MIKNYFFIIRAYNDIDHFTPILDYILNNKLARVHLYSSVPLKLILPNENLEYLNKEYELEPTYLLEPVGKPVIKMIENIYVSLVLFNIKSFLPKLFSFLLNQIIYRLRLWLRKINEKIFNESLKTLYDRISPNLVIYDWTDPSIFPYSIITKMAKTFGVPVVSIPHGLYIYLSVDPTVGGNIKLKLNEKERIKNNMNFDWYIVQNNIKRNHTIDLGIKKNTIVSMGTVRYDIAWLKKQEYFSIPKDLEFNKGELNIVIFPSKLHYKGELDAYSEIILNVCRFSKSVVLKPHTRHMRLHELKTAIKESNITVVGNEISSTKLINWCDVGIVWGSSIGIQLVIDNKPLVYPKYAHKLETIYDKYLPETICDNTPTLISRLQKINSSKSNYYISENKERFIREIVYGGDVNGNVSKRYTNFFESVAI